MPSDKPKVHPHARLLAGLASKYADDVIIELVQILKDRKSRQRVPAAQLLVELMMGAPSEPEGVAAPVGAARTLNREDVIAYLQKRPPRAAGDEST